MGIAVAGTDTNRKRTSQEIRTDWATAKKDKTAPAKALAAWMDGIERGSWSRRWASLNYWRMMTGRATGPASYNFSSTARPSAASAYGRSRFEPPRWNVLAQCSDALANRVYKSRPFLQVCPINGNFQTRFDARYISQFLDAAFYDLKLWQLIEQAGEDSRTWGDGYLKIDVSRDGKRIDVARVIQDEIVIDENECNVGTGLPRKIGIRVFVYKDDLLDVYGDDPDAVAAIERAPKANNGFYFGGEIDYTNVIVLREAWHCAVGKKPGRHLLTVGDYTLIDEKYDKDHPPLARLPFKQMGTYFSKGMPEMVLGLQRELDRSMAAAWENIRRAAWPRIGIAAGSNVDPNKLGDKSNGIYYYAGKEPKFDFPQAMSQEMFVWIQDQANRIKETFRVTDQFIQEQASSAKYSSGIAKVKQEEINDSAHIDLAMHLEDFVEQCGTLVIEAAEKCSPVVTLPGRRGQLIKWSDLNWSKSSFYLRAFPVGRLSKSMAFRQQQIDTWFAEGAISKQTKMRLEQVPDTDGYQSLANAAQDYVEMQLDKMIEKGKYEPPEPWIDIESGLQMAQARYLFEKTLETPQDRTDLILQYISHLDEMKNELAGAGAGAPAPGLPMPNAADPSASMAAPMPGFGNMAPAGLGPAPAPFPIAAPMAAPAPLA